MLVAPIFIGHSLGGQKMFYAARHHPEWMRALILVDAGFGGIPPSPETVRKRLTRTAPHRVHATLTEALARFRLA